MLTTTSPQAGKVKIVRRPEGVSMIGKTIMAVVGLILCGGVANAAIVSIGLQEAGVNGGAITNEGSGTNSFSLTGVGYGNFIFYANVSTQSTPVLLNSNIGAGASTNGTTNLFVTASGLTTPLGFPVTFTSNLSGFFLPAGWTAVEQTFLNTNNSIFGTGTLLSAGTFSVPNTPDINQILAAAVGAGPYSVTEQFTITASNINGLTSANLDINLSGVALGTPGPIAGAGLPFLALGYGAYWLGKRRRCKRTD